MGLTKLDQNAVGRRPDPCWPRRRGHNTKAMRYGI